MEERVFESGFLLRAGRLLSGGDFRCKPLKRTAIRGSQFLRVLGRHGRYQIIEVMHRGKKGLRYVREGKS